MNEATDNEVEPAHGLVRRDKEVSLLYSRIDELQGLLVSLETRIADTSEQLASAEGALAACDAEIARLHGVIADRDATLSRLEPAATESGNRPCCGTNVLLQRWRSVVSEWVRALYTVAPVPSSLKVNVKRTVFALFSPLFRHTQAYRDWRAFERAGNAPSSAETRSASAAGGELAPEFALLFERVSDLRSNPNVGARTFAAAVSIPRFRSWYLDRYRDFAAEGDDPLTLYLERGILSDARLSALFSTPYYLSQHPELGDAQISPLRHYMEQGADAGSDPHPLFWGDYYVRAISDRRTVSVNPLVDYLAIGAARLQPANPVFNPVWYLESYPDVAEMQAEPMTHYLTKGINEGLDPSPALSSVRYLELHPEVALAGTNPLEHLLERARRPSGEEPIPPLRLWFQDLFAVSRTKWSDDVASRPKVSVIIACMNQGRYVEEAVLSAFLATTTLPPEVIVIDDGSTEPATRAELKRIAEHYPIILHRQENSGLSAARNAGLSLARGDLIQFLDADDILLPGKIDHQLEVFEADDSLQVSMVEYAFCDALLGNWLIPKPSTIKGYPFTQHTLLAHWERGLSVPIHCGLFRRTLLREVRFSTLVRAKEDWLFWLDIAKRTDRCELLDDVLVLYRQHGQNMCERLDMMGREFLKASMIAFQKEAEPELFYGCLRHYREHYLRGSWPDRVSSTDSMAVARPSTI